MARARNIKPGFFSNDILGECTPLARLLFVGLWTLADREGRLEDRPKRIKAELLPYDDNADTNALLTELAQTQFIIRYQVGEQAIIQVRNFHKHQNPHHQEKASELPPEPTRTTSHVGEITSEPIRRSPDNTETKPEPIVLIPDSGFLIPDCGSLNDERGISKQATDVTECDSDLLEWIHWWNSLKAKNLVAVGASTTPSDALLSAWKRVQKSKALKALLSDRNALEAKIRNQGFLHDATWFSLPKLLGGKNKDHESILQNILDDRYTLSTSSKPKSANVGPGVNYDPARSTTNATF